MLAGLFVQHLVVERAHLERQAEQVDEAGRIRLVVAVVLVKGGHILGVQAVRRGDGRRNDITLVQLELDVAGNGCLLYTSGSVVNRLETCISLCACAVIASMMIWLL